jgi:hypothetical protein
LGEGVDAVSVFIVHPAHIDVMLSVAINGPKGTTSAWHGPYVNELLEEEGFTGPVRRDVADQAGRALLGECIASVSFLSGYPPGRLPGPDPNPIPEHYEWTDFGKILTPIECCKAVACYREQSGEHPGWHGSGARSFCELLIGLLIARITGYTEAEEEWTSEKVLARFSGGDP